MQNECVQERSSAFIVGGSEAKLQVIMAEETRSSSVVYVRIMLSPKSEKTAQFLLQFLYCTILIEVLKYSVAMSLEEQVLLTVFLEAAAVRVVLPSSSRCKKTYQILAPRASDMSHCTRSSEFVPPLNITTKYLHTNLTTVPKMFNFRASPSRSF